jgi:hypothetical protein
MRKNRGAVQEGIAQGKGYRHQQLPCLAKKEAGPKRQEPDAPTAIKEAMQLGIKGIGTERRSNRKDAN